MRKKLLIAVVLILCLSKLGYTQSDRNLPFVWENATVYFVLTDRFENGDSSNDISYGRPQDGPALRNYEGGDLQGLINKIEEGYFDDLGVNAIWITPPVENIYGSVPGAGYGFSWLLGKRLDKY